MKNLKVSGKLFISFGSALVLLAGQFCPTSPEEGAYSVNQEG